MKRQEEVRFQAFKQFNRVDAAGLVSSRSKLTERTAVRHFDSGAAPDRIASILGSVGALPIKEVVESFEMFQRIRKQVRSRTVVDLCAGHGLLGMLFGLFERVVEEVILVDKQRPPSFEKAIGVLAETAPWLGDKVTYVLSSAKAWEDKVRTGVAASVVSSHACGTLTDRCLSFAVERGCKIAVMPCCYPERLFPGPHVLVDNLGPEWAFDVDRTYRLSAEGYRVLWRSIPRSVTPMNRILIGLPE